MNTLLFKQINQNTHTVRMRCSYGCGKQEDVLRIRQEEAHKYLSPCGGLSKKRMVSGLQIYTHQQTHHKSNPCNWHIAEVTPYCSPCGVRFPTLSAYHAHQITDEHASTISTQMGLVCRDCGLVVYFDADLPMIALTEHRLIPVSFASVDYLVHGRKGARQHMMNVMAEAGICHFLKRAVGCMLKNQDVIVESLSCKNAATTDDKVSGALAHHGLVLQQQSLKKLDDELTEALIRYSVLHCQDVGEDPDGTLRGVGESMPNLSPKVYLLLEQQIAYLRSAGRLIVPHLAECIALVHPKNNKRFCRVHFTVGNNVKEFNKMHLQEARKGSSGASWSDPARPGVVVMEDDCQVEARTRPTRPAMPVCGVTAKKQKGKRETAL